MVSTSAKKQFSWFSFYFLFLFIISVVYLISNSCYAVNQVSLITTWNNSYFNPSNANFHHRKKTGLYSRNKVQKKEKKKNILRCVGLCFYIQNKTGHFVTFTQPNKWPSFSSSSGMRVARILNRVNIIRCSALFLSIHSWNNRSGKEKFWKSGD